MKKLLEVKERRVYFFKCAECGKKKRQSFRRSVARVKSCRKCKRNKPNPNQVTLFPTV